MSGLYCPSEFDLSADYFHHHLALERICCVKPMSEYSGTDNLEVMADAVNYNDYLLSLVLKNIKKTDVVLDFGAGIGTFAKRVSAYVANIRCVEPDARQAAVIAGLPIDVVSSIEQVQSSSLDFVYSFNVLEHIEDDVAALRQCYRVLKPGGRLLVYVPAFQILFSSMDKKVGHFRRYRSRELVKKLSAAGFVVEHSCYADSLGFWVSLLFKAIGSASGDINPKMLKLYDRFIFPVSRMLDRPAGGFFGKNAVCFATKR